MLQQLGYIKQIDGLRAIAVLMVVVFHWFPKGWVAKASIGSIGVDIFFVISGFLITRILLVYKFNQESGFDQNNNWNLLRRFMFRRALRIFPAYFILLFLLYHTSFFLYNTLSYDWGWYITYLQNFLFFKRQAWPVGKLSHFWTLAVEEQFYLIWPMVLLMIPSKRIPFLIGIFFLLGIISFHFLPFILKKNQMVDMLTPTCFHAFAAGAIVAWNHLKNPHWFKKTRFLLIIGFICLIGSFFSRLFDINVLIDQRSLVALSTSCLLIYILDSKQHRFKSYVLGSLPLVAIGKLSYGIYLYHNFIPVFMKAGVRFINKMYPSLSKTQIIYNISKAGFSFYVICFLMLIFIAYCSFRFFEQPLLKFKNKVA